MRIMAITGTAIRTEPMGCAMASTANWVSSTESIAIRARLSEVDQQLRTARLALDTARDRRGDVSALLARLASDTTHLAEVCLNDLGVTADQLRADDSLPRVSGDQLAAEDALYRLAGTLYLSLEIRGREGWDRSMRAGM